MAAKATKLTRLTVSAADGLTVGGKIIPQTFFIHLSTVAGAAAADFDCSRILPSACKLVTVAERHQAAGTDGSAVTLMVKKVPSGTAKASGTDCLASGLDMKATADTNQAGTLHAAVANYTFAAGDAVGLVITGTPTSLDGVSLSLEFQRV